jgi:hypothetical protein
LRNDDPWNWSYQWTYACWSQNDLSVVPHKNLVSNIGIGPDASNTKSDKRVPFFPERMESIEFPLVYPTIKRDKGFESRYRQKEGPTITRQFKNYLKTLPHKLHGFFKRQEDTRRTADNTFNRKFNGSESSKNIIGIINTQQK